MITLKEKAVITKEQHRITIDVGDKVPEGEYDVDIILTEKSESQKGILDFPVSDLKVPSHLTFSREEIYGDDGR